MKIKILIVLMLVSFMVLGEEHMSKDIVFAYDITEVNGKLRYYRRADSFCLNISGGAQFSEQGLQYILKNTKGNIFIVDLRQESHGFINGIPCTWYAYRNQINKGKTSEQIVAEEKSQLLEVAKQGSITLYKVVKVGDGAIEPGEAKAIGNIKLVETEEQLVKRYGVNYKRFFVLDRHKPDDQQVEAFIAFVKTLPEDAWLHFHCRGGRGRTTTFMIMYDIIHNAKKINFDDIVQRHINLGGALVDELPKEKGKQWKSGASAARYQFLRKFYEYIVDPKGYGLQSWEEWQSSVK